MTMNSNAFPISVSSLHFPSAEQSTSQTLSLLRRSALSVTNRLRSIQSDAAFVEEVATHYGLPLVANERCGSWYIPPEKKAGSAYFKSTDGHMGQWKFSSRRLNLHVLPLAQEHGGCIIVDSTRRGKLMPDALSKTIPIWCSVMNRALFPSEAAFHPVQFPPDYLGQAEEHQIETRIQDFVEVLMELKLDLDDLRQKLRRPIRLAWANPSYYHPEDLQKDPDYNLFVLCSASRRVHGAEISEGGYIQGAGDDSESWSQGLTAPIFWANRDSLFATGEPDLPDLIKALVYAHRQTQPSPGATLIHPTKNLYIGQSNLTLQEEDKFDLVIDCHRKNDPENNNDPANKLFLGCASSKLGSRDLRKSFDDIKTFTEKRLTQDPSRKLLVICETGKDLSAGVILAIICLFYNDEGKFDTSQTDRYIDKQFIRQRLAWIVSSKHDVNPSRATLQSVNAFILQR